MQKLKIAIIGIGRMGTLHAKTVHNNENCELIGFMDVNPAKTLAALAHYPTTCEFQTIEYIEEYCDAVIVATPASTHYDILKKLLSTKLHVLCEKPAVHDMDMFINIAQQYHALGKICFVGHSERFNPILSQVRSSTTDIRAPYSLKFVRKSNNTRNTDVSAIFDTMIHDIDLFTFLFRNVGSFKGIVIKDAGHDENFQINKCTAYIQFEKAKVCFQVDKTYQKEPKRMLYVSSMEDSFKVCFKEATITHLSKCKCTIVDQLDPLTRQLNAFVEHVQTAHTDRFSCPINSLPALQAITLADKIERECLKFLDLHKNAEKRM